MKVVFACFALVITYTSLAQTGLYLNKGLVKLPGKISFDVLKGSVRKVGVKEKFLKERLSSEGSRAMVIIGGITRKTSSSAKVQSKGIREFFRRTGTIPGVATRDGLNTPDSNAKKTQLAKVFRGYSLNSMSTKQAFTYSKALKNMAQNPYATIVVLILSLAEYYFLQRNYEDENKILRERLFEYEKREAEKKS